MGIEGVQSSSRLALAFETRSVDVITASPYGTSRSNQRGTAGGDGASTAFAMASIKAPQGTGSSSTTL
jgi:hypothetical protein